MIFQGYSQKKEVANKIKNGKDRTEQRQKKSYCIFLGKRAIQHWELQCKMPKEIQHFCE